MVGNGSSGAVEWGGAMGGTWKMEGGGIGFLGAWEMKGYKRKLGWMGETGWVKEWVKENKVEGKQKKEMAFLCKGTGFLKESQSVAHAMP